jgi:hypothetical protein
VLEAQCRTSIGCEGNKRKEELHELLDRGCCVSPSSGRPELLVIRESPSDRPGQLGERRGESGPGWLVDGDLVVSPAQILDKRVPGSDYPKPGHGFHAAHQAQPPFQLRVRLLAYRST